MKDKVHAVHRIQQAGRAAYIADVELELGVIVSQAHIVLFLLVAREDANFADVGIEEAIQHGGAEGAGAASDEQNSV